jgi:hypothetical protein
MPEKGVKMKSPDTYSIWAFVMPNLFRHLTCNSLFEPADGVLKQVQHDILYSYIISELTSIRHRGRGTGSQWPVTPVACR